MTGTSLYAALGLGFVLGLRHALDADHVAAVSTLVSQHRSLARSCLLGTFWGLGHTLALLAAGVAAIALRLTISPDVEARLEQGVGCMLVALGAHVLLRSLAVPAPRHSHGSPDDGHTHLLRLAGRPFVVGLVHGMAGSAALTVLVAALVFLALLVFIPARRAIAVPLVLLGLFVVLSQPVWAGPHGVLVARPVSRTPGWWS